MKEGITMKNKKVKIKDLLTIPQHIRGSKGEIVEKVSETESRVLVGTVTYVLKNRYLEESTDRLRLL